MTRRERVLASIGHRQPDRVPVDLGATPSSGISAIAYSRLRQTLGVTQGRVRVYEVVQQVLMIVVGCNLFEWGCFLRRMDNFLMDLLLEEANVERLLDALMERHLATLEKVCRAVGDVADIIRLGDDLGMDTGPFMSRELYQRLFKPRHAALCRYVRGHSSMATFLHSCGSIAAMIPDLIDAGFQILNPVQTNARDMEPERLKREFGKDIVFWGGGVDTRSVLNRGSPQEVRAQVRRRLEIFSRDGGFVFNPVHNMLPDVPPENIVAMFDAVTEFNGDGMPPGAAGLKGIEDAVE